MTMIGVEYTHQKHTHGETKMTETKFDALRNAAAFSEGKLSAFLDTWQQNGEWFKTPAGFEFMRKELQAAHDMLEAARKTV
jgi:hypothetical protein